MLSEKLNELKKLFMNLDAYGDAYVDIQSVFEEKIDSINESNVSELNSIKKMVYDYDLFYSDQEEIEESGVFALIDTIIQITVKTKL